MKKNFLLFLFLLPALVLFPQQKSTRIQTALREFESDPQLKNGQFSLLVIENATGKALVSKNSQTGMTPASTLKLLTSVMAMDQLGPSFRFETQFAFEGNIADSLLTGNLFVTGSGDPTLGSTRYSSVTPAVIEKMIVSNLKQHGIRRFSGNLVGITGNFPTRTIPGGWVWEDVGNYYGAGPGSLNWNEDQYDIIFKPGTKVGEPVGVLGTAPSIPLIFRNELTTGEKGSGDQVIIYFIPGSTEVLLSGSVPCCVDSFRVSGAVFNADQFFLDQLQLLLKRRGVISPEGVHTSLQKSPGRPTAVFCRYYSPSIDSINYWFLKKSINLYGEALLKKMAFDQKGDGSTETGIMLLEDYWKARGISATAINLYDASGLSPLNRVTASALVNALRYAKTRPWFPSFFESLPVIHGIAMKSGTISGVRCYAGYLKDRLGKEYSFAFMVNNFNGSGTKLVNKMWKLLDLLKG